MPPLVVVIGDALLDVQAIPTEPMRPGGDVPAAIRLMPGGQGANVAVRLARRGVRVRLVCAIGDDPAGQMIRESLVAERVDLVRIDAPQSGAVVVVLDASGDRTMLSHRAAVLGQRVVAGAFADADWVLISGYVLLEPAAGIPAIGTSPRRVVLGCSLGPRQSAGWIAAATSLAPHLVVLNLDEALTLIGGEGGPTSLAREVGKRLGAIAVVTHRGGAAAVVGDLPVEVTGHPTPAVDATGAGDAFAATLVANLLEVAWPPPPDLLHRSMTDASNVATAVAGVPGAQGRVDGERTGASEP